MSRKTWAGIGFWLVAIAIGTCLYAPRYFGVHADQFFWVQMVGVVLLWPISNRLSDIAYGRDQIPSLLILAVAYVVPALVIYSPEVFRNGGVLSVINVFLVFGILGYLCFYFMIASKRA